VDPDKEVNSYYEEHHKKLTEETKKILKREKNVLILDLHSFSNEQALSIEKEEPFPDICIGINEGFANNEILNAIIKRIEANGYSYKINYPYSGSIIPNGLTKSELENVCSIMIEVNKRLYL
jgi:N-formylglutamate deformylase